MTEQTIPPLHVSIRARMGDSAEISITGTDVRLVSEALLHFGLATPQAAAQPDVAVQMAAPATEADPAPAPKKARAKKEEPAAAPVDPTPEPAAEPAAPETPAAPAASSAEPSASPATPEEAAAAVKAFGAKNGIDAARSLLQKFGFARTGDITAEKAGEIVQAASV